MSDFPHTTPRNSFLSRPAGDGEGESPMGPGESPQGSAGSDNGATRRRATATASTAADFTGNPVPGQFKLPADLLQSLKLISIQEGRSMSQIVYECLTSDRTIGKAWVSTRRS